MIVEALSSMSGCPTIRPIESHGRFYAIALEAMYTNAFHLFIITKHLYLNGV